MILGKAISPFALRKKSIGGGGGTDPDAQLFITATGISGTNATATNQLVIDLKAANIWTKMKAVYPMVGGTATTCKFNLKNPVDSNAAYRLTFFGGGTFSSNGYQGNGTNSYANTFLNPVTTGLVYNNNHLSFYSRTSTGNTTYDMGSGTAAAGGTSLFVYRTGGTAGYDVGTATANRIAWSGLNGLGFFLGSSITTNVGKAFRSGIQLNFKNPLTSVSMLSFDFYLGGFNEGGTVAYYSNKQCAFASIGDGLTDAEALALYNAVQNFNTTLGRQV